ncbi:hypothetical protein Msi02_33620 [Microbispora siamensis]|uniref:Uncharacterized protein n=1 Tax=Microbispora siamensis TaxID=564413 RepID=A0ABQ4GMF4_9ACTN|nr:hypothetical protein Msi02_33620 [Microbispora siamensis]
MLISEWDGGYTEGGPVLTVIAVSPAVAVGWAVPLLWRHGTADWWDRGRPNAG